MTPIRVLLVDDEWLVRAGLATMLSGTEDIEIVGEAADGRAVPEAVARTRPQIVLMDIRMPRMDGVTATAELRRTPGAPEVILLTTFHTDELILGALRAGANGFLLKDTPPPQIVEAIRRVAAGEPILSPTVTRKLMAQALESGNDRRTMARTRLATLRPSERKVAEAIGTGASNAEVADTLTMSLATIKSYTSRILARLDLTNRVQLALLIHDAE
jgi:DNA-binding NarL/FixJ family response regulator